MENRSDRENGGKVSSLGSHALSVRRSRYIEHNTEIFVENGKTRTLQIILNQDSGKQVIATVLGASAILIGVSIAAIFLGSTATIRSMSPSTFSPGLSAPYPEPAKSPSPQNLKDLRMIRHLRSPLASLFVAFPTGCCGCRLFGARFGPVVCGLYAGRSRPRWSWGFRPKSTFQKSFSCAHRHQGGPGRDSLLSVVSGLQWTRSAPTHPRASKRSGEPPHHCGRLRPPDAARSRACARLPEGA